MRKILHTNNPAYRKTNYDTPDKSINNSSYENFHKAWKKLRKSKLFKLFLLPIFFIIIGFILNEIMKTPKYLIYGFASLITLFIWLFAYYMTTIYEPRSVTNINKTLEDYFKSDFPNGFKIAINGIMTVNNDTLNTQSQLHADFDAQSCFISYYLPKTPQTFAICCFISKNCDSLVHKLQFEEVVVESHDYYNPTDKPTELKNLQFSRRVFIYHETTLLGSEIDSLVQIFKEQNLFPQFRSIEYVLSQNNKPK